MKQKVELIPSPTVFLFLMLSGPFGAGLVGSILENLYGVTWYVILIMIVSMFVIPFILWKLFELILKIFFK